MILLYSTSFASMTGRYVMIPALHRQSVKNADYMEGGGAPRPLLPAGTSAKSKA